MATRYNFAMEYAGDTFFDRWTFFDHSDNLTNGDAMFLAQPQAKKRSLAFVNGNGHAVMRVDNSSIISFGDKRESIRITSKDRFKVGSVWIADFLHVPYGCSTWPAFWSTAPDWPNGGEIDTFEGINDVKNNRMTLHTEPGCVQANATQTSTLVNSTDCSYLLNGNQGCVTSDPQPSSYGEAFAKAGGGIYVTEFAESGVSIWFFNRSSIPASLQGQNVTTFDTATFGTPVANWPNSGCNIEEFFKPQNLVFDITLCGDLAGFPSIFAETCPGDCYDDWVAGHPSNFDNAYFEVKSVKVYGSGPMAFSNVILANDAHVQNSAHNTWTGLTVLIASVVFAILMQFDGLSLW
ncbi:uncharacterized protein FOMMEDRAFT_96314 [Fomitiporia mediterranea MF3/22]|uniref:uncharacterized protein n=1 Tax=Fomitiporia mediterranea (strain MF3/22) TaxID=694068 RepID=UPI00044099D7|nr:uncharacterized protein FOMMEDRAFT_96314 [Fomitiporia mediterranea MF3/22]EJC98440.1 hypothetical protein FOMMEDRAFT_96314 [Fomitiporia mediterranea MF3/22]